MIVHNWPRRPWIPAQGETFARTVMKALASRSALA